MADKHEMDAAAQEASRELERLVLESKENDAAVELVARFWDRWYRQVGHRRLARLLLEHAPTREERGGKAGARP